VLTSAEQGTLAVSVSEQDLRQQLQGKTFYLRGGYLENPLHFDQQGKLDGHALQGSYTLSLVEIDRVKLDKHRVVLEGVRYGLHFLGALPTADQSTAMDKVRLTPKKKPLVIAIDREQVVKPKKEKEAKSKRGPQTAQIKAQPAAATQPTADNQPQNPAQQAQAEPDRHGAAVTISEAQANQQLTQALDRIFAAGIDDRMIATLPDYWKLFYKAVAEHQDFKPSDPAVMLQSSVDRKAKLVSVFEPPSNEYAQNNGVAGMAMYHVVLGPDGKPGEIAVGRPIGFGLDENAVKAIRQATFQPAIKDGKPVPVMLDLLVQFRIYSKRTGVASSAPAPAAAPAPAQPQAPILPGPYTANSPRPEPQPEPQQPPTSQPQP
jgi:TonB family protein